MRRVTYLHQRVAQRSISYSSLLSLSPSVSRRNNTHRGLNPASTILSHFLRSAHATPPPYRSKYVPPKSNEEKDDRGQHQSQPKRSDRGNQARAKEFKRKRTYENNNDATNQRGSEEMRQPNKEVERTNKREAPQFNFEQARLLLERLESQKDEERIYVKELGQLFSYGIKYPALHEKAVGMIGAVGRGDEGEFLNVMADLAVREMYDLAVGLYQQMQKLSHPSPSALVKALKCCGAMRDSATAWKIWTDYDSINNRVVNERLYHHLLDACVSAGDRGRAFAVLSLMEKGGVKPSQLTYNMLLNVDAKTNNPDGAFETLNKMMKEGIEVTAITFNTLINALAAPQTPPQQTQQQAQQAQQQPRQQRRELQQQEQQEQKASRSASLDKAFGVLELMAKHNVKPTEATFNSLIKVCMACGDTERALKLLDQMNSEHKVTPNALTYNTLINTCAKESNIDMAFKLLDRMEEADLIPDQVTFNSLIKACMESGEVKRAISVLDTMKEYRQKPNVITFTSIINTCAKKGDVTSAFEIFGQMTTLHKVKPDEVTFTSLVNVCINAGEMDKAMGVLDMMKGEAVKPNVVTFNSLLKGCVMKSDLEKAMVLLKKMKEEKVAGDKLTFDYFMKVVEKNKTWLKAFEGVEVMEEGGTAITRHMYDTLHYMTTQKAKGGGSRREEEVLLQLMTLMQKFNEKHKTLAYTQQKQIHK